MKKIILSIAALAIALPLVAQWATSGTNIYNSNTGNVDIGTTKPLVLLDTRTTTGFATVSAAPSDVPAGQQLVSGANNGAAPTLHELTFNISAPLTLFWIKPSGNGDVVCLWQQFKQKR